VVAEFGFAVGASLSGATLTVTVPPAEPPWPSEIV
jgi:hypothetical protein